MNGKLGGLFQDNQIGGILDWVLTTNYQDTPGYNWELEAQTYWFFLIPQGEVTIKLYSQGLAYWEVKGDVITAINPILDTFIHDTLIIRGNSNVEGKIDNQRADSFPASQDKSKP